MKYDINSPNLKKTLHSAMNVGRAIISLLIVVSLSVDTSCIYPHHLGFRLKPQSKIPEDSKSRPNHPGFRLETQTVESASRSTGANSVVYCFASNCDEECTTKCISISKATGRPVSASKPKSIVLGKEKQSSAIIGSFLKLVTRGLLKKIPMTALVRLTVTEEGLRGRQIGRMQKITRVQ